MKKIKFAFLNGSFLLFLFFSGSGFAQHAANSMDKKSDSIIATKKLPAVNITDLKGNAVDVSKLSNDGKPFVLMFWATWCAPCIRELNNIADLYTEWQEKTGVKIFAIAVDDSKSSAKVPSVAKGKRWEYEVFLDKNQDLMRALNFQMPPFTVLLDGQGNITWTHNSYVEGDEFELGEKLMVLSKNK